jgi:hypothetical protein
MAALLLIQAIPVALFNRSVEQIKATVQSNTVYRMMSQQPLSLRFCGVALSEKHLLGLASSCVGASLGIALRSVFG